MTSIPTSVVPDAQLRDAAINAMAIASVAYHTELERFRYVITLGLRHGASVEEAARATGLTCEQISTLVNQGEL
jgi:hypothetical protein